MLNETDGDSIQSGVQSKPDTMPISMEKKQSSKVVPFNEHESHTLQLEQRLQDAKEIEGSGNAGKDGDEADGDDADISRAVAGAVATAQRSTYERMIPCEKELIPQR